MSIRFVRSASVLLPGNRVLVVYRFECGGTSFHVYSGVGQQSKDETDADITVDEGDRRVPGSEFTTEWLRRRYPELSLQEAFKLHAEAWKK